MRGSARTILLVEDDPGDEALTLRAFRRSNLANRVDVVRDGAEALEYLYGTGRHAGRAGAGQPGAEAVMPAVVLLDLKLPRVDGLEVLAHIRSDPRTRRLPVVVLTSSGEDSDVVRSYDLGVNSYVRKPVQVEEFLHAVGQLGLYWAVLNEDVHE